jgi:hypothetical protein
MNNGIQIIKYGEFLGLQEERLYSDLSVKAIEVRYLCLTYLHEAIFSKLKSKICSHLECGTGLTV